MNPHSPVKPFLLEKHHEPCAESPPGVRRSYPTASPSAQDGSQRAAGRKAEKPLEMKFQSEWPVTALASFSDLLVPVSVSHSWARVQVHIGLVARWLLAEPAWEKEGEKQEFNETKRGMYDHSIKNKQRSLMSALLQKIGSGSDAADSCTVALIKNAQNVLTTI